MASKTETTQLLSLGFSYLEIARELYPQDYKRYVETRDRKLYQRLKLRAYRLPRNNEGRPFDGEDVDPQPMYTPMLDDGGGGRDVLAHREPEHLYNPKVSKAGLKGLERQQIEYEYVKGNTMDRVSCGLRLSGYTAKHSMSSMVFIV